MKLPSWIWKTNTIGTVAVANMVVLGICGIAHMAMFTGGIIHVDTEPQWKLLISTVMGYTALLFTFPLGWIVEALTAGVSTPPIYSPFYVPLNAYLWGWVALKIRGRKSASGDLPPNHSN